MAGIVVNNAIVLVDFIQQLRRKGLAALDAIIFISGQTQAGVADSGNDNSWLDHRWLWEWISTSSVGPIPSSWECLAESFGSQWHCRSFMESVCLLCSH